MYTKHKFKVINIVNKKQTKENFYCLVCNYPLKYIEDFNKNDQYKCCHECYLNFAEARKKEWLEGWRPSEKNIKSYINLRKEAALNIIKNKGE